MSLAAEIVLTGGPCAGKTTALSYLTQKLPEWGYRVLAIPEAATMYIQSGLSDISAISKNHQGRFYEIEATIVQTQTDWRAQYQHLAEHVLPEPCVLVYDRGPMDALAYVGRDRFYAIMEERGWTLSDLRDSYDAAIHLVTAANGAAEHYTLANNSARREDLQGAIKADQATQEAWIGHPHLRIIDNSTDFEGKMRRLLQQVARVLGVPIPLEIERKFVLKQHPDFRRIELSAAQQIEIEQVYLLPTGGQQHRIRRRSQNHQSTYYETFKSTVRPGVRHETEHRISPVEYHNLLSLADPTRQAVRKSRWCFVYRHQYFELDIIREPSSRVCVLLELELTEENDEVDLPPFLAIDHEVTDDPCYTNANIALG